MPSIPISPAQIASAGVYTAPANAQSINLCRAPAEGMKCIPMQFQFNIKPGWLVGFPNSPNAPMSQISSLFVDTSDSVHGATIFFPDTGYSVTVEPGGCRIIPVITGANANSLLPFYVLLDSSGALTTDIVNVIALNQFVPEFGSNEISNNLSYGFGSLGTPVPIFAQSAGFIKGTLVDGTHFNGPNPLEIISASQFYITAFDIFISAATTDMSTTNYILNLLSGVHPVYLASITITPSNTTSRVNLSGLNILSDGTGSLTAFLNGDTSILSGTALVNVYGGIIAP